MATYIKSSIRTSTAQSMLQDIERNVNQYFFFIAKSTAWSNDSSPDFYVDTVKNEYDLSRNIIGYKKIRAEDILFSIRRYDWIGGTVYDQYTDSEDLFDKDSPKIFYVYTINRNIYKCLNNNGGAASTQMPDLVLDNPFTLSDGYVWKYLGTVTNENEPDTLTTFLPIEFITNSSNSETQNQYNAQLQARSGTITRIDPPVYSVGATAGIYPKAIRFNQKGGLVVSQIVAGDTLGYSVLTIEDAESIVTLNTINNQADSASYPWTDYIIRIVKNNNNISEIGNYGVITNYNNADKQFTIRDDVLKFSGTIEGSLTVEVLPFIKVIGDGSGAYLYPVLTDDVVLNKSIAYVEIGDGGSNYSHIMLDIIAPPLVNTSSPILTGVLPPKGGHASNILSELKSDTIFINILLDENDQGTILTGGEYRQFGIIKNPTLNYDKGTLAGKQTSAFRDISLLNLTGANTNILMTTRFPADGDAAGKGDIILFGKESLVSTKISKYITANDTTKILSVTSTGIGSDFLITTQNRPKDYLLGINKSISSFINGETVTQNIPAGITFITMGGTTAGISYGYSFVAKGIVIPIAGGVLNGNTLGIKVTENNFVISSSAAGITGSISGATATIFNISPRYGEIVNTIGLSGGATFTSQDSFKVLEVGPYYFSGDVLYTGLTKVRITGTALSSTTYPVGALIEQGVTGDPDTDYASGIVYDWENAGTTGGILNLTDIIGKFKISSLYGATASKLTGTEYVVDGVTLSDIDVSSGEIIYIDNVVPIDRIQDQKEKFRLTITF
jgi:hypothetical protein